MVVDREKPSSPRKRGSGDIIPLSSRHMYRKVQQPWSHNTYWGVDGRETKRERQTEESALRKLSCTSPQIRVLLLPDRLMNELAQMTAAQHFQTINAWQISSDKHLTGPPHPPDPWEKIIKWLFLFFKPLYIGVVCYEQCLRTTGMLGNEE
jgi:hypothetical protein